MARSISFNTTSFQNFDGRVGIVTTDIDDQSIPTINAPVYTIAHANQSRIPTVTFPNRIIKISGYVQGSTLIDLDNRIDSFKYALLGQYKNLDIDYAGATRRYTATMTACDINRPGGLLYAKFNVEFTATQPFGQSIVNTTALNATGRTAGSYTDVVTFLGTAPYQKPIITITLTAVSSTGSQTMNFGNNANGQQISVTRSTWATSDQLIIDTFNKTVTVNGTAVDYSGAFPEFPPGVQTFGYSDSFTSRTLTENVVYGQLFL